MFGRKLVNFILELNALWVLKISQNASKWLAVKACEQLSIELFRFI